MGGGVKIEVLNVLDEVTLLAQCLEILDVCWLRAEDDGAIQEWSGLNSSVGEAVKHGTSRTYEVFPGVIDEASTLEIF